MPESALEDLIEHRKSTRCVPVTGRRAPRATGTPGSRPWKQTWTRKESLLQQRAPLDALILLEPLLAHHGDDPNARRLAARAYFHSAQLSRAHDVLRQLVAEAPDDSCPRLMPGRTLQRLGRHEEAAVHLKTATAMTPGFG